MGIGVSLAVLTIPLLLEYLDWQTIWAILGCLCLVIAGMIKQYLNIEPVLVTQLDSFQAATENTSFWQIVQITLTHPPIICLAIIFACYTSQWITVTGFLPTLYVEQGLDLKRAGMLVSIVVLANLGGTFGAGMLLQQGYRPHTLWSTGFVAMLCSSGLVFAANAWLSFELQVVSALLFSLIGGMIPTTVFCDYPALCTTCLCSSSQCGCGFTNFSLRTVFYTDPERCADICHPILGQSCHYHCLPFDAGHGNDGIFI